MNYVQDKVVLITGAGSGFGELTSKKLAGMGAKLVICDIVEERINRVVEEIKAEGGDAIGMVTDISKKEDMFAFAEAAVEKYGRIDVMVNNAGIMPLAFFEDWKTALPAWEKCIDINLRGTLYGILAVYDQMVKQGRGHVVNLSTVYANSPVAGGGVYQATKIGVRYLTEQLRQEAQGKIKVTIINPTGVSATNLAAAVMNPNTGKGIRGWNWTERAEDRAEWKNPEGDPELKDPESIRLFNLPPQYIMEAIVHAINQPWGVDISNMTVRASGEEYML